MDRIVECAPSDPHMLAVVALAGTAALGVTPASADTTIKLTTSADETTTNNGCSLREALMYAAVRSSPSAQRLRSQEPRRSSRRPAATG